MKYLKIERGMNEILKNRLNEILNFSQNMTFHPVHTYLLRMCGYQFCPQQPPVGVFVLSSFSFRNLSIKLGVHLTVTIATIAEKSVSDHSDQMDKSLLMIPMIITIVTIAIAGIGSGSIPAIASAIVTIAAIIWTQASDRERSERSSYFSRCTAVLVHFMLILISCQKI